MPTLLRTNLVTNPVARSNVNGYVIGYGTGGAGTCVSTTMSGPIPEITTGFRKTWTVASSGGGHELFMLDLPVTAGVSYTALNWVKRSGTEFLPTYDCRILWYTAASGLISSSIGNVLTLSTVDNWLFSTVTAVAPANAVKCRIYSFSTTAHPLGAVVDATGFFLSTKGPYFDGATPDTNYKTYEWSGAVDNSASHEYSVLSAPAQNLSLSDLKNATHLNDEYQFLENSVGINNLTLNDLQLEHFKSKSGLGINFSLADHKAKVFADNGGNEKAYYMKNFT